MKIEIIKPIAIGKTGLKSIGDNVDIADNAAKIYIAKGFAKEIECKNPELTANEVAELISKCETLEDLEKYKDDTRQVASIAYKKKLKELE